MLILKPYRKCADMVCYKRLRKKVQVTYFVLEKKHKELILDQAKDLKPSRSPLGLKYIGRRQIGRRHD
jgi:hypothetical protein